jgi:energy-coupling factor transporter ATP-binding protein EcfA2
VSTGLAEDGPIVYVPRRPLLPTGGFLNLYEQILAPPSAREANLVSCREHLDQLAQLVGLQDFCSKGLAPDASLECLQRLAIARLLWQRPVFAILDEATSALPPADEDRLLGKCRDAGITLVTISQRVALQQVHCQVLTLEGRGRWRLDTVETITAAQTQDDTDPKTNKSFLPDRECESSISPVQENSPAICFHRRKRSKDDNPDVSAAVPRSVSKGSADSPRSWASSLRVWRVLLRLQRHVRLVQAEDLKAILFVLPVVGISAWSIEQSIAFSAAAFRFTV